MALQLARARGMAIGRLRVAGAGEPVRLRLGIERQLASSDLVGTHLPVAAILVVRRFVDPLPGQFRARAAMPDPRWQLLVRETVDRLADGAARPADGAVDPAAPAVRFTDRAELLYCAICDLLSLGSLGSWWWRDLRLHSLADVIAELIGEPGDIPALIARLDRRGLATALAHRIGPAQAADLVRSTAQTFGVSAIAEAALDGWPRAGAARLPAVHPETRRHVGVSDPLTRDGGLGPALSLEQGAVVALALGLASPVRPRLRAGVEARHRALVPASLFSQSPDPTAERASEGRQQDGEWPAKSRMPPARQIRSAAARPGQGTDPPGDLRPRIDQVPSSGRPEAPTGRSGVDPAAEVPVTGRDPDDARGFEGLMGPGGRNSGGELSVSTALGGLFHLVHIGQVLGLYGDFTSPAKPGIPLNIWDFVTLVGEQLGAGRPRDPVWSLLAGLAGRDPWSPAGAGYRPPRVWRVPPAWLGPFDASGRWRCHAGYGRARLIHPAGFPVVDGSGLDLDQERRRYVLSDPVVEECSEPDRRTARERWVGNLAAYVRARLGVAMHLPPSQAPRVLLRRPAVVEVTSTRVDVTSSLSDLSISVRVGGLDRDPGFVPAAGRSLWYHFS